MGGIASSVRTWSPEQRKAETACLHSFAGFAHLLSNGNERWVPRDRFCPSGERVTALGAAVEEEQVCETDVVSRSTLLCATKQQLNTPIVSFAASGV